MDQLNKGEIRTLVFSIIWFCIGVIYLVLFIIFKEGVSIFGFICNTVIAFLFLGLHLTYKNLVKDLKKELK